MPPEVDVDAKHVAVDFRVTAHETVIRDAQSDVVGHGVIQRETHRQEIDFLPHLDAVDLGERPVPIEKVDGAEEMVGEAAEVPGHVGLELIEPVVVE